MNARVEVEPAINLTALRIDVRRAVAIAKIAAFEDQAHRLGNIIAMGLLTRRIAADLLQDVAVSNGLVDAHGNDSIQSIISDGLERK
jgi:hypothetical protein